MVVIDSSAWIDYFRAKPSAIAQQVDQCLALQRVAVGDLIYFEVMQGVVNPLQKGEILRIFDGLPQYGMVGFDIAARAAQNYASLRSKGITVRKAVDMLIGTFCAVKGFALLHNDRDFDLMAKHIGLTVWKP